MHGSESWGAHSFRWASDAVLSQQELGCPVSGCLIECLLCSPNLLMDSTSVPLEFKNGSAGVTQYFPCNQWLDPSDPMSLNKVLLPRNEDGTIGELLQYEVGSLGLI